MRTTLLRRSAVTLTVLTIVVGPTALYIAPAWDVRAGCQQGKDWATAHANALPQTMSELVSFPSPMRRAIFHAVSPDRKAAMWKEQLAAFRESTGLSAEQRDFIARASSAITPDLYRNQDSPKRTADRAVAVQTVKAAQALFTREQFAAFVKLGSGVHPSYTFASLRFSVADAVQRYGTALAGSEPPKPECDCSEWYNTCGPVGCLVQPGICETTFGCGPFGDEFCYGFCA